MQVMGVIDEDYLQKAVDPSAILGRKVRVTLTEVEAATAIIAALGARLFSGVTGSNPNIHPV